MAELEVIKHTKKVLASMSSDHGTWHKVKEIFIEIFIIVFAISLSIWFHNWSEHRHQQAEVKQFLIGLKEDLQKDIVEMSKDKDSYRAQGKLFSYLSHVKLSENIVPDSIKKHGQWLFNTTALNPNDGRFEGFKSSGKIGSIEDAELQNDIMGLYQENIPALQTSTEVYIEEKKKLFDYIEANNKRITDSTSNLLQILHLDPAHNIYFFLENPQEIINRYDACISKCQTIVDRIDHEIGAK